MSLHQSLYKTSKWLGVGGLLLSVFIATTQMFMKASISHQAEMQKAQTEADTQASEKKAESVKRELDAFQKADKPQIDRLILNDVAVAQITADHPFWKTQPKNRTIVILDKFENCAGIWKDGKFTKDSTVCNSPTR